MSIVMKVCLVIIGICTLINIGCLIRLFYIDWKCKKINEKTRQKLEEIRRQAEGFKENK